MAVGPISDGFATFFALPTIIESAIIYYIYALFCDHTIYISISSVHLEVLPANQPSCTSYCIHPLQKFFYRFYTINKYSP